MRILFLNRWVGVHVGGTETHIKDLARTLSTRGHKVEVITTRGDKLKEYESVFRVRYLWKNPKEPPFSRSLAQDPWVWLNALVFSFMSFFKILSLSRRGRAYDVVSVHCTLEALIMLVARTFLRLPFVFVFEGYTFAEGKAAKFANSSVAISRDIIRRCQARHGYSPILAQVGIDSSQFQVDGSVIRNKYKKEQGKLILTVCRLDPRKDLPTLIQAAKMVLESDTQSRFLIVGDGIARKQLQGLVDLLDLQDSVKIIPELPVSPEYYAACDLFVLPSLYEGFGIVFLEAMSAGLPIISTTASAIPEVVGDCGILVPPKRPDILAAAILQVLGDDVLRTELIRRGLKRVQDFSWQKLISSYESAYYTAGTPKNRTKEESFSPYSSPTSTT